MALEQEGTALSEAAALPWADAHWTTAALHSHSCSKVRGLWRWGQGFL